MAFQSKAKAARDMLNELFSQKAPEDMDFPFKDEIQLTSKQKENLTLDDVFWIQLAFKALKGDMKAIQEVLDRRFGKAPQHILQENHNYNYTNFLEEIAKEEQHLQIATSDRPQVQESTTPEGGGLSGDSILDDLGLFE